MTPKDLERQKKLEELQEQHRELSMKKKRLKKKLSQVTNSISQVNKELNQLGGQILDLKNLDGDTPHITDHAVVRYLERVKGVNIWEIKAEIVQHKDAIKVENTIVTVNGDEDE